MVSKKNALGKGLGALLENAKTDITSKSQNSDPDQVNSISRINIFNISPNPFQPRIDFEKESLEELSNSIKEHGIIQPITVRKMGRDHFQIISGERRFQAAKIVGISEIPAFIRIADDKKMLEMAIVENIQRKDLNAIEIGLSYQRLIDECQLTHSELSQKVSKDRSTVSNFLRLLKLPLEIQKAVRIGDLSMGHARAILSLGNDAEMINAFKKIKNEQLSVRDTEKIFNGKTNSITNGLEKLSNYESRMQNDLSFQLKSKVIIKKKLKRNGKIFKHFKSQDQLNEILYNIDQ